MLMPKKTMITKTTSRKSNSSSLSQPMKIKLRKSVAVAAWSVTPKMKNLMLNLKMLIKKDHEKARRIKVPNPKTAAKEILARRESTTMMTSTNQSKQMPYSSSTNKSFCSHILFQKKTNRIN